MKSAYYKTSLKVHPDRVAVERKDAATRNFQTLGKVYIVLSDTERRKLYDETGMCGVSHRDCYLASSHRLILSNEA